MTDALLLGVGDLGTQIGLDLAEAGVRVVGVRRRVGLVPNPLVGVAADLADGLPDLPAMAGPGGGPDLLIACLTAGGRDESAYRATFLDALTRVLDDIRTRGWAPQRAVFVSSTGVCASSGTIDESTPADPQTPTARILAQAEQGFLDGLPHATRGVVVRPSGIYGPGREWFVDQVRRGVVKDPSRMTHRVHRDDVARAVTHLLTMTAEPEAFYLVTDDEPAPAGAVAAYVAEEVGASPDAAWLDLSATAPDGEGERRLSNARLRSTGFGFAYPSFREGYRAVLAGEGGRHP